MQITVRTMAGEALAVLSVHPSQTVLEVKRALCHTAGISIGAQGLQAGVLALRDTDHLDRVLPRRAATDLTLLLKDKREVLKARWLYKIAEDWTRLLQAPESIINDLDVMSDAIARSFGQAFRFAGAAVRADPEVVLDAMRHDATLAYYADPVLVSDVPFMLAAAEILLAGEKGQRLRAGLWRWPWRTSPALCASRTFMLSVVLVAGENLAHASEALKADPELVLAAVGESAKALLHADESLRRDAAFILQALQVEPAALKYASAELRGQADFARLALARPGPGLLCHLSEELQGDWEIAALAVRRCGGDLMFASPALREDRGVAGLALLQSEDAAMHLGKALQLEMSFILPHLQRRPGIFAALCEEARAEPRLALEAVRQDGELLRHVAPELRADVEVAFEAVRQNPKAFRFVEGPARECFEVCVAVVEGDWRLFDDLPKRLQGNREIIKIALRGQGALKEEEPMSPADLLI